jgi:hypothetical protein
MTEWLALLEAELARRTARQEWADGEDDRQREWVHDTLVSMAQCFAAAAASDHPLQLDDMSPAEKLCCHLLPAELRPAGLPTEAEIWSEFNTARGRE